MARNRKKYSEDFKKEAVNLLLSSDRGMNEVATDLGIGLYNLVRWKKQYLGHNSQETEMEDPAQKMRRLEKENARLEKENALLRQERDILKKAMGIVSKQ